MHRNFLEVALETSGWYARTTQGVNSTDAGRRSKGRTAGWPRKNARSTKGPRRPPARIGSSALFAFLRGDSLACDPRFFPLSGRHYSRFLSVVNCCSPSACAVSAQVLGGKGVTAGGGLCALEKQECTGFRKDFVNLWYEPTWEFRRVRRRGRENGHRDKKVTNVALTPYGHTTLGFPAHSADGERGCGSCKSATP